MVAEIQNREPTRKEKIELSIANWLEDNLGARVDAIEAFTRQRDTWRVDYTADNESHSVLAKGSRPWAANPFSLLWEMQANQVLREQGCPVPKVVGLMEDPAILFMEWVDSDVRPVGLLQQTTFGTNYELPEERRRTNLAYMEELARIHAIPASAFADCDVVHPQNPEEIAMALFMPYYNMVDSLGIVDARIEFIRIWLERNVPEHRSKACFVTGDCCQYLSRGTEIVALIDFEISYLGDCLQDLACYRARHPVENLGDIYELFRHYAQVTGEAIDKRVLAYHTAAFLAISWMGMYTAMHQRYEGGNALEEYGQVGISYRRGMEAIAEYAGIGLELLEPPTPLETPYVDTVIANLVGDIESLPDSAGFGTWEKQSLVAAPMLLKHFMALGPWYMSEGKRDIEELTGEAYADFGTAREALMAHVRKAGPEQDEALVRLFHRDAQRECWLGAGPGATRDHLLHVPLEPMFDKDF